MHYSNSQTLVAVAVVLGSTTLAFPLDLSFDLVDPRSTPVDQTLDSLASRYVDVDYDYNVYARDLYPRDLYDTQELYPRIFTQGGFNTVRQCVTACFRAAGTASMGYVGHDFISPNRPGAAPTTGPERTPGSGSPGEGSPGIGPGTGSGAGQGATAQGGPGNSPASVSEKNIYANEVHTDNNMPQPNGVNAAGPVAGGAQQHPSGAGNTQSTLSGTGPGQPPGAGTKQQQKRDMVFALARRWVSFLFYLLFPVQLKQFWVH